MTPAGLLTAECAGLVLVAKSPDLEARVSATLDERRFVLLRVVPSLAELRRHRDDEASILLIESSKLITAERNELRALAGRGGRPFLILAETADEKVVRRAMAVGAAGVVRQGDLEATLEAAMRAALVGLACFPIEVRASSAKPVLTTREKQILGMVVLEMSNADIARRLYVAESTVKSHLSVAYSKLGVRSRNEAAAVILDPKDGYGVGILHISDPAES